MTGISDGTVNITYTHVSGSCTSIISKSITVLDKPVITLTGTNTICAGQTTTFAPSTGGTWTSSNPGVASINSSGVVLGINAGIATFTFQNGSTGCYSNPSQNITVYPRPVITFTGPSNICVGNTTNILPSSGGIWTSSNSAIATINSNGFITGVAAGMVTLTLQTMAPAVFQMQVRQLMLARF
ncbi:MAG: Ig-like domain-containing protein [Saprospiraceae bacterium]|nr:Ig-like domain-containing protein [Saprospiraceae bacterium]